MKPIERFCGAIERLADWQRSTLTKVFVELIEGSDDLTQTVGALILSDYPATINRGLATLVNEAPAASDSLATCMSSVLVLGPPVSPVHLPCMPRPAQFGF